MIGEALLWNLVAYVLQSSAIVIVALAALGVLRVGAASIRYAALRATLGLVLLLPVLQPRVAGPTTPSVPVALQQDAVGQPATSRAGAALEGSSPIATTLGSVWWTSVIAILLIAGIAGRLLWMSAGLWRLQRLRRAGETAAGEDFCDLQRVIGTRAELRYVARLEQPLTFGFRRPIVLLPDPLRRMPASIQRAVVAHELWHVRRVDWFWMVTEEAVRSTLWFHPAVWILLSRIQLAREETVDELAVLTTGSRRGYLDALLAFADARPLVATAAFARRRHLLHRMLTISKESAMSSKRFVASCAALGCAVVVTAWSAAAAFPLVASQNPPPRDPRRPEAPVTQHQMVFVPAGEEQLQEAIRQQPTNPANYRALAALYAKAGDFDRAIRTIEALVYAEPSNPRHHQLLGVYHWEKAFRDSTLTREQKMASILSGIEAIDRALLFDPEYVEALIYKNLLLRLQAAQARDVAEQQRLTAEADALRSRGMALMKQRGAVSGPGDPSVPPPPPPPPPPAELFPIDGVMPVKIGGTIPPPLKIRDVRPVYPPEAQAMGQSGMVIIEAVLDAGGLVRGARILRSSPPFDQAALDAVRQWQFLPTIVDGIARPVVMTVTVNFTLQ